MSGKRRASNVGRRNNNFHSLICCPACQPVCRLTVWLLLVQEIIHQGAWVRPSSSHLSVPAMSSSVPAISSIRSTSFSPSSLLSYALWSDKFTMSFIAGAAADSGRPRRPWESAGRVGPEHEPALALSDGRCGRWCALGPEPTSWCLEPTTRRSSKL